MVNNSIKLIFNPNWSVVANVPGVVSIEQISEEQGVYSASPEFVRKHCGKLAIGLLDKVPSWYYNKAKELGLFCNLDIRIHRLYPGDYPAYPGWHCDGEFRETYFSQPDLNRIKVHNHLVATLSTVEGGVSNTQFLCEPLELEVDSPDQNHTLWGQVHKEIESKPRKTKDTEDGQLILFDSMTPHRAMPSKVRGWRLFFRMSMWHRPYLGEEGKLTKQEQIYKTVEGSGW